MRVGNGQLHVRELHRRNQCRQDSASDCRRSHLSQVCDWYLLQSKPSTCRHKSLQTSSTQFASVRNVFSVHGVPDVPKSDPIRSPPSGGIAIRRVCWSARSWFVDAFVLVSVFVNNYVWAEYLENGWR